LNDEVEFHDPTKLYVYVTTQLIVW